jgi:hypothetical protein
MMKRRMSVKTRPDKMRRNTTGRRRVVVVVVDRAAAAVGERVWSSRIEYMGYCRRGMA